MFPTNRRPGRVSRPRGPGARRPADPSRTPGYPHRGLAWSMNRTTVVVTRWVSKVAERRRTGSARRQRGAMQRWLRSNAANGLCRSGDPGYASRGSCRPAAPTAAATRTTAITSCLQAALRARIRVLGPRGGARGRSRSRPVARDPRPPNPKRRARLAWPREPLRRSSPARGRPRRGGCTELELSRIPVPRPGVDVRSPARALTRRPGRVADVEAHHAGALGAIAWRAEPDHAASSAPALR